MQAIKASVAEMGQKLDSLEDKLLSIEADTGNVASDIASASSSLATLEAVCGIWGVDDLKSSIEEAAEQITGAIQMAASEIQDGAPG